MDMDFQYFFALFAIFVNKKQAQNFISLNAILFKPINPWQLYNIKTCLFPYN